MKYTWRLGISATILIHGFQRETCLHLRKSKLGPSFMLLFKLNIFAKSRRDRDFQTRATAFLSSEIARP